jgi:hypothetical protein
MGVGYDDAKTAVRVSLSAETIPAELDLALSATVEHALALA